MVYHGHKHPGIESGGGRGGAVLVIIKAVTHVVLR